VCLDMWWIHLDVPGPNRFDRSLQVVAFEGDFVEIEKCLAKQMQGVAFAVHVVDVAGP
jgi:hypothetical protein